MSTTPTFSDEVKLTGCGNQPLRHEGSSPMMLIISILALIGALRFRKQARAAGIGQATEKGAAA